VLEHQQIFNFLDTEPLCISARHNRSAFGSDGDYFCKPSAEDVFKTIYNIMHQAAPGKFPNVF
jgi:hypothetical protein